MLIGINLYDNFDSKLILNLMSLNRNPKICKILKDQENSAL